MAKRKRKQEKDSSLVDGIVWLIVGLTVVFSARRGVDGIINALLWVGIGIGAVALAIRLLKRSRAGRIVDAPSPKAAPATNWQSRIEISHPDALQDALQAARNARFESRAKLSSAPAANATAEAPCKPSSWSIELIRSLDWKRFEELVAAYWRVRDFRAETTGRGADGGVDVLIYKPSNPAKVLGVIQCKSHADRDIGVGIVRELFGVMHHMDAPLGVLATTTGFTSDARAFAHGKHLVLLDGPKLIEMIGQLSDEQQQSLLALATEGDYTTPSCPKCEVKLVVRSRSGDGGRFYGCQNFPKCRYTLNSRKLAAKPQRSRITEPTRR